MGWARMGRALLPRRWPARLALRSTNPQLLTEWYGEHAGFRPLKAASMGVAYGAFGAGSIGAMGQVVNQPNGTMTMILHSPTR